MIRILPIQIHLNFSVFFSSCFALFYFLASLFIFIFKTFFFSIQYQNKQFLKERDSTNCLTTTGKKIYNNYGIAAFYNNSYEFPMLELICECAVIEMAS